MCRLEFQSDFWSLAGIENFIKIGEYLVELSQSIFLSIHCPVGLNG